ncbi:MAG: S8 family peptidase [Armatimonadota bacterium]|nr:S8 family peptidase [Armatimonadota bacterium]
MFTNRCRFAAIILLALLVSLCLPLAVMAAGNGYAKKIVIFDTNIVNEPARQAIIHGAGGVIVKPLPLVDGVAVLLPEPAVAALTAHAGVIRVDDDIEIYATGKPSQPSQPPQPPQSLPWGIARVNAPTAWDISVGMGVKVAVLDTGIQLNHPDLAANIAGGYNATNPVRSPSDGNGHGTHVAGTIAAANNSIGVVGVAPQARLYAVKALGNSGLGTLSDVIEGLTWCIDNGIQVVNMSLGASTDNETFHNAIIKVYEAGITQVVAAGNNGGGYGSGTGAVDYPGAYPEVIAVSAIDSSNRFAVFSSAGPAVDLAAPGVNVLSTYIKSGYATMSGTSMATPHVTGVVALRLASHPGESPDQVKAVLQSTAVDLGLSTDQQGAGLVNAYAAVTAP